MEEPRILQAIIEHLELVKQGKNTPPHVFKEALREWPEWLKKHNKAISIRTLRKHYGMPE